jgi:hypothetical protein
VRVRVPRFSLVPRVVRLLGSRCLLCASFALAVQLLDLESHAIRNDLLRTAVDRTTIMQQQIDGYMRGTLMGCGHAWHLVMPHCHLLQRILRLAPLESSFPCSSKYHDGGSDRTDRYPAPVHDDVPCDCQCTTELVVVHVVLLRSTANGRLPAAGVCTHWAVPV